MSVNKIEVNHTNIKLYGYSLGDYKGLEKDFSIWDKTRFKPIPYYHYDEDNEILTVPRGADLYKIHDKFGIQPVINKKYSEYKEVNIKLIGEPRNELQRDGINFICGIGVHMATETYSQLSMVIPTGEGKTFITIASICQLGIVPIIIVPTTTIKTQWVNSLMQFTNLRDEEIGEISGSYSIKYLMNNNHSFKVFITTHSTIQSYTKKNGWSSMDELFRKLGIGIKVVDEAHKYFMNTLLLDYHTSVYKSIYLTATFNRSDLDEDKLYQRAFSNTIKFVPKMEDVTRKHVYYVSVLYDSKPSIQDIAYMQTAHGFNKHRFANYMNESSKFYEALAYILNKVEDRTVDHRILILASAIETVELIKKFVKTVLPSRSVSSYHSNMSMSERRESLNSDIIVSTPQSAGEGFDTKKLKVVIMTEPYSSKVETVQVSGRLRLLNDEDNTLYIEMVDTGFKKVVQMYKRRLPIFKEKCLKLMTMEVN